MKKELLKSFGMICLASGLYAGDTFSFALVNLDMDYREYTDNGQILDSERSKSMPGFEAGYKMDLECREDGCPNLEFKALVFQGNTDYVGSYLGSGQPYGSVKSTTANRIYDLSLDYTQTDNVNNFGIKYGVGLGYHSWYRELSSIQNEEYYWFYLTPIVGLYKDVITKLNIGVELKYKYAIDPKMTANTVSGDFELGGVDTVEISVPLSYALNDEVKLIGEYTYAKQKIKRSNVVSGYYEPKSTDKQQYFKIGVCVKY